MSVSVRVSVSLHLLSICSQSVRKTVIANSCKPQCNHGDYGRGLYLKAKTKAKDLGPKAKNKDNDSGPRTRPSPRTLLFVLEARQTQAQVLNDKSLPFCHLSQLR